MSISLHLPTLPKHLKVTKRVLYIAAVLVVLGLLITLGAVQSVQTKRQQDATNQANAQVASQAVQTVSKLQADNKRLTSALSQEQARTSAVCQYVKTLKATPAIASRISVPTVCP